jgi:hypothetical protein
MDQDVKQLQADVHKLQIELARLEASRATTRVWILAAGALVCAWLGINSLYFIPRMVDKEVGKTTAGQAAAAIKAKKLEAFADASKIKTALNSANRTATEAQEVLANMKVGHFGAVRFDEATVTGYDWWIRANNAGDELAFGNGADHTDAGILFTIKRDGTLMNKSRRPLLSQ